MGMNEIVTTNSSKIFDSLVYRECRQAERGYQKFSVKVAELLTSSGHNAREIPAKKKGKPVVLSSLPLLAPT